MSLRFNQVFAGLLALSILSAFLLPASVTNPLRGFQALFSPVSRPARALGSAFQHRFAGKHRDARDVTDVKDENARLRAALLSVSAQLEEMTKLNQNRALVGPILPLCTPFAVVANDAGVRDSISIDATSGDGVKETMAVVYANGMVGVIDRVGIAGAQVMLITDPQFKVRGRFYRYTTSADGKSVPQPLESTPPLVRGVGKGMLAILNVPLKDTALVDDPNKTKVNVGDVVALDDPEWPTNLKGQWIGQIESIQPQRNAPQVAEILIRPTVPLATLSEVMVMNKIPGRTPTKREAE
jgi:hypothetical protein